MNASSGDGQIDDETRFWIWFFEKIAPIRGKFLEFKKAIGDSPVGGYLETATQLGEDISDALHESAKRASELTYSAILRSPATVCIIILLSSFLIGKDFQDFEHQINGDVEIYLPDGANSTDLLNEVREQWSTDIVILYVQTNNAATGSEFGTENITDSAI